ncbi:MAG: transporter [Burkholderiaceae bacterium]|jgi:hypothetical protein|nr:transporter [Burkholderiaceae bacterium]
MKTLIPFRAPFGAALLALAALTASAPALATEGGGSVYPVGAENFVCCALPPPGVYGMVYGQSYSANKLLGNDGSVVTPSTFKVNANALVPRVVWVTPYQIGGASLAFHAMVPIVNLDVRVAPGMSQSKTGIGDIVFGTGLGWHLSEHLHTVVGVDFFAPTGDYNKDDLANIGRNYWAVQPLAGISYIDPEGLNADLKLMWTINARNKDTQYTSGQELIVDYALGWGLGKGWVLGVGGYLYQQITNDKSNGFTATDNKGRAMAIGPSIKYDSGKGWFLTLKYQKEFSVRNRTDGSAFWLKAVVPF